MGGLTHARFVVRSIDWSPLVVVGLGALVVVVLVGRVDATALAPTTRLCGGALAAAVALTTRDPARELLAALPVSLRRRCWRRSVFAAVPALLATVALVATASLAASGPGTPVPIGVLPPALALTSTGVAIAAWVGRSRPGVAVECAAVVTLAWAAAPTLTASSGGSPASWWADHPWWVVAGSAVLAWWALRG